ncbi:MAG: hypothetical protein C0593_07350 [Marinilabiliales bacterium]|nr:MAG: hypothetical protein C0593_07350 [Marinilabiliales bacterium]
MGTSQFTHIRSYLLDNLGLYLKESQEAELSGKLKKAAAGFGYGSMDAFIDFLLTHPLSEEETGKLASFLTIGETYFFRENKALDYLEREFLPKLVNSKNSSSKKIRVWSAGCSTGEEPYSLAIILSRVLHNISEWDIRILATDINPDFLAKAREGIYSKWSFRKSDDEFRSRYFKQVSKQKFQIKEKYRKMVTFFPVNLITDIYPSENNDLQEFDIIFCRNVLIYFAKEGIMSVAKKMYDSINKEGLFVVSPVEAVHIMESDFQHLHANGTSVFIKSSKKIKQTQPKTISITKQIFRPVKPKPVVVKKHTTPKPKPDTVSKKAKPEVPNYNTAWKFYRDGNHDEAIKIIQHSLSIGTGNREENLMLLASVFAGKADYHQAEQCCHDLIQINKVNPESHFLLAGIYMEQNRYEEAISALKKTLFLDSAHAPAHFFLGNIYQNSNNQKNAQRAYRNAYQILSKLDASQVVLKSEGITAGNLAEMIFPMLESK